MNNTSYTQTKKTSMNIASHFPGGWVRKFHGSGKKWAAEESAARWDWWVYLSLNFPTISSRVSATCSCLLVISFTLDTTSAAAITESLTLLERSAVS